MQNSKELKTCPHKNLHVNVHSVIHNSQNVEKTYASVDEWINKMVLSMQQYII